MKHWLVTFNHEGAITSVSELIGPAQQGWVIVEALDAQEARRVAYNKYCSLTKTQVRARNYTQGKCVCGRMQDRPNPAEPGEMLKTCSVCSERQKVWNDRSKANKRQPIKRDEKARLEANQRRQRDRKKEMRVEVLVEVKRKWNELLENANGPSNMVKLFDKWIDEQVKAAM